MRAGLVPIGKSPISEVLIYKLFKLQGKYVLLGGHHLFEASKTIQHMQNVNCIVYENLTDSERVDLAVDHNRSLPHLKLSFMDLVSISKQ